MNSIKRDVVHHFIMRQNICLCHSYQYADFISNIDHNANSINQIAYYTILTGTKE